MLVGDGGDVKTTGGATLYSRSDSMVGTGGCGVLGLFKCGFQESELVGV